MEYVLETKALVKKYKNFTALNGLTMRIPKGSIYGFVGKNGAGKTTLIRLICGLQVPTDGEYILYGVKNSETKIARSRRRMGAVVETPSIYLDMTAEENIREQYCLLGVPSDNGIPELLHLVGLGDTVALAGNPDFLVLDEPINGLDPQGIVEMRELILKLNREQEIACRKCVRCEVSDTKALARVLDDMKAEYKILNDTQADVYAEVTVS